MFRIMSHHHQNQSQFQLPKVKPNRKGLKAKNQQKVLKLSQPMHQQLKELQLPKLLHHQLKVLRLPKLHLQLMQLLHHQQRLHQHQPNQHQQLKLHQPMHQLHKKILNTIPCMKLFFFFFGNCKKL